MNSDIFVLFAAILFLDVNRVSAQCPNDWTYIFGSQKCYQVPKDSGNVPLTRNWEGANAHCQSIGGELVAMKSKEEEVWE